MHYSKSDERHQKIHPFTLRVEFHSGVEMEEGNANFDSEPYFPSFAMLLDGVHALILKAKGPRTFTRIGTARLFSKVNRQGSNEAAREVVMGPRSQKDCNNLTYSAEYIQAAEIANGLRQAITIY